MKNPRLSRRLAEKGEVPNDMDPHRWQQIGDTDTYVWIEPITGLAYRVSKYKPGPGYVLEYAMGIGITWNSKEKWTMVQTEDGLERVFYHVKSAKQYAEKIDTHARGIMARYRSGGSNYRDFGKNYITNDLDPRKDYSK